MEISLTFLVITKLHAVTLHCLMTPIVKFNNPAIAIKENVFQELVLQLMDLLNVILNPLPLQSYYPSSLCLLHFFSVDWINVNK